VKIEAPRGTHDILPADQPLWRKVTQEAERLCALYGYRPIQTPVFEDTELFQRTSGEGSDVVQKEMYTFTDRSDRSLTLRPEGTAPICRAYLTHGLQQEPQPQKLYTIGPMYRYGRPGKGRYREHWQLSVEALGSDDPALDAEVIHLYDTLLRNLGVSDYTLELNSIGDRNCRPAYVERLSAWLRTRKDELDDDTRHKLQTSPLRALDNLAAKPAHVQEVLREAPAIGDSLCDACVAHFAEVRALLDELGVAYTLVPTLVRGLDYYTRTTWEFIGPLAGANSTISGGGRYDGLIEEIGGPPTPGVGLGAGIERLLLALEDADVTADPPRTDVFLAVEPGGPRALALRWLKDLRNAGVAADTDYAGRSLKGQLTQAGRSGAHTTVIVGAEGATLRRQGAQDQPLSHADVVGTLLR
jgi:histidyl-tRNA synthetase